MKYLLALISLAFAMNSFAASNGLGLVPDLLQSTEVQEYLKSEEAVPLALIGIEWNSEGADTDGELVEFRLMFWKSNPKKVAPYFIRCSHPVFAYYSKSEDGPRTFIKAKLDNSELVCKE